MTAPEQWFDCPACEGTGITGQRITVYEHGCGFPHYDTEERPCARCNGAGGYIGEAESDGDRKR